MTALIPITKNLRGISAWPVHSHTEKESRVTTERRVSLIRWPSAYENACWTTENLCIRFGQWAPLKIPVLDSWKNSYWPHDFCFLEGDRSVSNSFWDHC
jgi:hypothetical protein